MIEGYTLKPLESQERIFVCNGINHMPLIYACIAPHGDEIIPELNPAKIMQATHQSMITMGMRLEALQPDTVIVLTPHGVRVDGMISISFTERAEGALNDTVKVAFEVDQELARQIAHRGTSAGVTMARTIYGATSGEGCCLPLDWGAIIPLWFMGAHYQRRPRIVVMCPSRRITNVQLAEFGKGLAAVCDLSDQRIALIASADQAHTHAATGPYGFSPMAGEYDRIMQELVRANQLYELLILDPHMVSTALPDSLWQTLILAGALRAHPMHSEVLSYEVAEYFGMLCAAFENPS
jgi:aromatic ring-opening dioxygenase LigB subunit